MFQKDDKGSVIVSNSIISNERECLVCKTTYNLHKHHIFGGNGRRKVSERNGAWCYLCAKHHNMSDNSVHMNHVLDLKIKRMAQEIYERDYGWSREKFIATFGRNYLES